MTFSKALGWGGYRKTLSASSTMLMGAIILGVLTLLAVLAPWITEHDPLLTIPRSQLLSPSMEYPFGTDIEGRDVFSRCLYAIRVNLTIGVTAAVLAMVVGTIVGAVATFRGGWADTITMRIVDVIQAFPVFILALGVMAAIGQNARNLVLVIAFVQAAPYVRLMRARLVIEKELEYVDAARCSGHREMAVLFRYVLPNTLPIVIMQLFLSMGYAILATAGLSFIGLGISPPTPEWGSMVFRGLGTVLTGEWWVTLFPAGFIVLSVMAFNLLGDGIQDSLDPRRRGGST